MKIREVYTVVAWIGADKVDVAETCGHKHRSLEAAQQCLLAKDGQGKWYNADILRNGEVLDYWNTNGKA